VPNPQITFSDDEIAEMVRLYTGDGMSLHHIGRRFYCSHSTIRRMLAKNGVAIRKPGSTHPSKIRRRTWTEEEAEYVDWLYWGEGKTVTEIGKIFGITESAMSERMNIMGIPRRGRGETSRRVWAKYTPEQRRERGIRSWEATSAEAKARQVEILGRCARARSTKVAA
jgi:transposase-like protein